MQRYVRGTVAAAVMLVAVGVGVRAYAGEVAIAWWSIDAGGMSSSRSGWQVVGTIGQADAASEAATGGGFELVGGFWGGVRGAAIPGDLDDDGDVDLSDLAILIVAYGTCEGEPFFSPEADVDGSGCVDVADLAILLTNYGVGT